MRLRNELHPLLLLYDDSILFRVLSLVMDGYSFILRRTPFVPIHIALSLVGLTAYTVCKMDDVGK